MGRDPRHSRLPADIARWWCDHGQWGEVRSVRACGWPGGVCRVFRVRTPDGCVYVKQHPGLRSFGQERWAYAAWAGAFSGAPRLLAADPEHRLLVLSRVEGRPASDLEAPLEGRAAWHCEAGRQLARLHALPHRDDDPTPLGQALPRRVDAWCDRGREAIDLRDRERVVQFVNERVDLFDRQFRVPCHLDYDERNWLVARSGRLAVIDFEHARADHWLADLVRLETGVWTEPDGPSLRRAFFAGYGRPLTAADVCRLDVLCVVGSLATIAWARQRGDDALEATGRRGLNRITAA